MWLELHAVASGDLAGANGQTRCLVAKSYRLLHLGLTVFRERKPVAVVEDAEKYGAAEIARAASEILEYVGQRLVGTERDWPISAPF